MSKSILSAVAIAAFIAVFCVGCGRSDGSSGGGVSSALVGSWIHINGIAKNEIENMDFFKDGTGILDKDTVSWKVENGRFVITSVTSGFVCNYKIFGDELILSFDDGDSAAFLRKEKLKEYKTKQIQRLLEEYFVTVKGGTFTMGCTSEQGQDCFDWESPTRKVKVGDFQIGKYEVTQKLWELVMGENPSEYKGDDLPVVNVSWDDVQIFISALNSLTGKNCRLPAEAEWEYAARGGNKSKKYKYSGGNNLDEVGWYDDNSGLGTHPTGQKKPNELGIYDMSGNVWEWCSDWYDSYSANAATNHTGAVSGLNRVRRGGGGSYYAVFCRVAYRGGSIPSGRYDDIGFRLVLDD